ncbi:MAG TPA: ATPase, T2SS/T4P/T4SS family, partial [Candidatus Hydrogenedentes bacterium]|nr:ATPase, T2SS/T4P/T4SS family [Candidatus Hydrogenedentota bacterium]
MSPVTKTKLKLGEILIEQGAITPLQLDEALQRQHLTGDLLGRTLVSMGYVNEQAIIEALSVQQGMDRIDVTHTNVAPEVLKLISSDVARFYNVLPVRIDSGVLVVAMADPLNIQTLDDIRHITGMDVRGAVSNPDDIHAAWQRCYAFEVGSVGALLEELKDRVGTEDLSLEELGQQEIISNVDNLVELAQQPEVIKIVNLIFLTALQKRASDIHFEVYEEEFRIRIRVDGVLHEIVHPPKNASIALVSRVK